MVFIDTSSVSFFYAFPYSQKLVAVDIIMIGILTECMAYL
jgi:hypothetical protein